MKKLFLAFLLLLPFSIQAQTTNSAAGNLTAASASCLSTNCVTLRFYNNTIYSTITLSGTWSATVQFEVSGDFGNTWVSAPGSTTSSTSNGTTQFTVGGFTNIRARVSSFVSGTVVATVVGSLQSVSGTTVIGGGGSANVPSTTYTLSVTSGGAITATTNGTGSTITGTDLRAVWDSIVAANPAGGRVFFKNGTYNCNSLDQESTGGFSNYYCVGIPGSVSGSSAGTMQYGQWFLEGESASPVIDQFGNPVQTNGVIINLTSTAISSVAANSKIMIVWSRPDTVLGIGSMVFLRNLSLRVPTNQRGCETGSDVSQALSQDYENVDVGTQVAEASLVFPVEASCTSWGATDPGGLIGLTTTNSIKQENWMRRSFCFGCDVGLDIRSEHTILEHSYAGRGNHGIDYGVRGGTISHSSVWLAAGCGEVARCLTLGANMGLGSALTIWSFDIEDACNSGGGCSGASYLPVYHALETNAGNTNGLISWSDTLQATGVQGIANFWDGGGGGSFAVLQATSQHNLARNPASDSFTRANSTGIGPGWITNGNYNISSNAAVPASSSSAIAYFVGQGQPNNDQFAQFTIGTNTTTNQWGPHIRITPPLATLNAYACLSLGSGSNTLQIYKATGGSYTTLGSSTAYTAASGDVIELDGYGSNLYCNVLSSAGALKAHLYVSDSTWTSGWVGIYSFENSAVSQPAITNFKGGSFATRTGTDSIYNNPMWGTTYNTITNCAATGTAASPSVASCGSAASGSFSCATNATGATCQVNTTAVTAQSAIIVQEDETAGAKIGVTCNTSTTVIPTSRLLNARSAGTSFTINLGTVNTNPACFDYWIIN